MSKKPPLTVEDILTAFRSRLTQPQRTMLKVLRDNSGSTATELAKKMGWDDCSVWDRRLRMMCEPRRRWLGYPFPPYSALLVDFDPDGPKADSRYYLTPEAALALSSMPLG